MGSSFISFLFFFFISYFHLYSHHSISFFLPFLFLSTFIFPFFSYIIIIFSYSSFSFSHFLFHFNPIHSISSPFHIPTFFSISTQFLFFLLLCFTINHPM